MRTKYLPALMVLLTVPCTSMAATVTINSQTGAQSYVTQNGIREDTVTRGGDLTGMVVTASYQDGTSEDVTWGAARRGGQVTGSGFDLFFGWRAFELSVTKTLASLSLNARTGNAIFDISPSRAAGEDTVGTKRGFPFQITGANDPEGAIDVTYSGSVAVADNAPATDAFANMLIDFSGLAGGGLSGDLEFQTDLDSLAVQGDLTAVPLPASVLMFASAFGLLGFGAFRRKAVL